MGKADEKSPIDESAVNDVRAHLAKKYGPGVAPTADEMVPRPMPTGIPQLDDAIGIGGLPRGRIIDVFGDEAIGKTALHMIIARNILERNPKAQIAWIDLEHKLSTGLAQVVGLDLSKVLIVHPPSAEAAFSTALDLIGDFDSYRSKKSKIVKPLDMFDLVVFDSVAAAVTEAELGSEIGDVNIAPVAKLMADSIKRVVHPLFPSRTVLSFINQMRAAPMQRTYGHMNTDRPTGGKALKFYATVRLEINKSEYVKEGKTVVGLRNKITVRKNGVAEPFKVAEYVFNFKHGIDFLTMLFDEAVQRDVVKVKGSYYSFGEGDGQVKWLGKESAITSFREEQTLYEQLKQALGR